MTLVEVVPDWAVGSFVLLLMCLPLMWPFVRAEYVKARREESVAKFKREEFK